MKGLLIGLGVLVLIGVAVGGTLVNARNQLVTEREAATAAYQQVDVDLQRRLDLIPNLVNTVKGFAKQEQTVIKSVTDARAAMMGARTPNDRIAANQQLDTALGRLFVSVENYPELKSNENFLNLQDELSGTENRIAVDRRRYNEALRTYNTDLQLFPNNIAASLFGFTRDEAYFTADQAAEQPPEVSFE
jgi:LemA protein